MEVILLERTTPSSFDASQCEFQSIQHSRLSRIVFANKNGRVANLQVELGDASEVLNFYASKLHAIR